MRRDRANPLRASSQYAYFPPEERRVQIFLRRGAYYLALLGVILISVAVRAEVAVPALSTRVTDLTGTLSAQQKNTLEETLRAFETQKGAQIAVLMVPTTQPETIEQYALRVAEQWKLGRKGIDDGALLLIAKNDRALRIEVGYGLEGALNDATAKRIIAEIITPYFKGGDFFGGIQAGIQAIMKVVQGEPLPAPAARSATADAGASATSTLLPLLFLSAFIIAPLLRSWFGRFPAALASGALATFIIWLVVGSLLIALGIGFLVWLFALFSGLSSGRGGWGRGGYYGGGLGRGGGFGGGFGGGGGGFGGGGASGRW